MQKKLSFSFERTKIIDEEQNNRSVSWKKKFLLKNEGKNEFFDFF
jgi:hypothetical protein